MKLGSIRQIRFWLIAAALALLAGAGGCVSSEPPPQSVTMFIGRSAQLVAHGKPPLDYLIKDPGNYCITDDASKGVLCFGAVQIVPQHLKIDPSTSQIVLQSGKDSSHQDVVADQIDPSIAYDIYFTVIKSAKKWWWPW